MSGFRRLVKSVAEWGLGSPAALRMRIPRFRGRRLVLAYHNVVAGTPAARGDASLHLPLQSFREQLDVLQDGSIRVVPLHAPLRHEDEPSVAITFDDAYAGATDLAIPELARRGLPATLFVAPGLLGSSGPWWDRLGEPTGAGIPPRVRRVALEECGGAESRVLETASALGWPLSPLAPEHRIATEAELTRAVAAHPGLMLGVHTWSHPNLAVAAQSEVEREVRESLLWLQSRYPERTLNWLAYPYGLQSSAAQRGATGAGISDALLVTGGWHDAAVDRLARPRVNVTAGLSAAGFRLRIGGFTR